MPLFPPPPLSPLQANYGQVVKAMAEAERYPGTSLLVAYSPCALQGIDGGMCNAQGNAREAAASGYWPLYRLVLGGGWQLSGGMCNAQGNAREEAASGYWPLYRLVSGG